MLLIFTMFLGSPIFADHPNPENMMLSNSLNSFMFYGFKDPVPFSDPAAAIDLNNRMRMHDHYREESEYMIQLYRQQQLYNQTMYRNQYNRTNRSRTRVMILR